MQITKYVQMHFMVFTYVQKISRITTSMRVMKNIKLIIYIQCVQKKKIFFYSPSCEITRQPEGK